MVEHSTRKASLRDKAVEEFKLVLGLALYLYVCLGALVLFKMVILREAGVSYSIWGIAAVKALVLAKFMVVGRAIGLGKRYQHKPLIWPTLYQSLMFLLLLLVLTAVEEVVMGFIDHRPLIESLTRIVGPTFLEGLSVCLVMFLILIPYCGYNVLGSVLGEDVLFRLFFVARDDKPVGWVRNQQEGSKTG